MGNSDFHTGTGKTTLTNAIIDAVAYLHPGHRLVIIEDTNEIQCKSENAVVMRSNIKVSMLALLKVTMRMRPDHILVGEVRGGGNTSTIKSLEYRSSRGDRYGTC